ncbi:MAG: hypothetical protein P4L46_19555 [Fimbriimonas sp.]|nr:hypothetical protein [Fimbriimonas sp.]
MSKIGSLGFAISAFAYPYWRNLRTSFAWAGVALLALGGIAYWLQIPQLAAGTSISPTIQYVIGASALIICGLVAGQTTQCEGILGGQAGGGLLPNAYILPVKTRDLVLAPIIISAVSAIVPCLVFWAFVAAPLRFHLPVLVPLLLTVLVLTSLQASSWLAGNRSIVGIFSSLVAGMGPFVVLQGFMNHLNVTLLESLSVGFIGLSVFAAVWAASSVRHSSPIAAKPIPHPANARGVSTQLRSPAPPALAGALPTQIWYESLRKTYLVLPTIAVIGFLCYFVLVGINDHWRTEVLVANVRVGRTTVQFVTPIVLLLLGAFLFAANSQVMNVSTNPRLMTDYAMDPFLAIRPIPTALILAARLRSNIYAALLTSGIVIIAMGVWVVLPATDAAQNGTIYSLVLAHLTHRGWGMFVLSALCLPLLIWSNLAGEPFQAVIGSSPNMARIAPYVLSIAAIAAAISCMVVFAKTQPSSTGGLTHALLGFGTGLLISLKFILAIVAAARLLKRRLVEPRVLGRCAGLWLVLAALITLAFYQVLPEGRVSALAIALTVLLLLPANRILWQIVSLDAKRHV